ncbi:MAG: LysR family transcriptional regulator, partial [Janthinobacterium lividum]
MPDQPDASDRSLPPLNAIRCYAAVVREGGVTAGAAALGITQSAASRHVATLERYLGFKLTERRGRGTGPTDAGRAFAQSVADALETIDFTARHLRSPGAGQRLIVRTSLPSFAYGVLVPRLQDFAAVAP